MLRAINTYLLLIELWFQTLNKGTGFKLTKCESELAAQVSWPLRAPVMCQLPCLVRVGADAFEELAL